MEPDTAWAGSVRHQEDLTAHIAALPAGRLGVSNPWLRPVGEYAQGYYCSEESRKILSILLLGSQWIDSSRTGTHAKAWIITLATSLGFHVTFIPISAAVRIMT